MEVRSQVSNVMAPSYRPTSDYARQAIRGREILISNDLDKTIVAASVALIDNKLYEIGRIVPSKALKDIGHVPIWLERQDPPFDGGEYHPSREWLVNKGFNPDKAKAIEFGNAQNFLDWSLDQPMLVLHELAHAYHDQVLGYENAEIREAYERAKKSRTYDAVLRSNGKIERAYAMEDDKEYFAELTEAYFGANDFYPFVRAEVEKHDPEMFELLRRVWT